MSRWVEFFAQLGREGRFDHEPGFPAAMERFRKEVVAGDPQPPTWDVLSEMMMRADIRGTEYDRVSGTKTLGMCWADWAEANGGMP